MKQITIELPGIKAVSRNQTTGHYIHYHTELTKAENWMVMYGKHKEYHFTNPVIVEIEAYYKVGYNKLTRGTDRIADAPNIDDKIFTDVLIRYKKQKRASAIERRVWFIEDDNPKYLVGVWKKSIPSTEYKVVITIKEAE